MIFDGLSAFPLTPTRGIDLDALVGRPFSVGTVRCFGQRPREPCLRADTLGDGEIHVGDEITANRQE